MKKEQINNIKLGFFVLAGLSFLIFLLYILGRNESLFGSNINIKARFKNVQGLMPGNNVRYSGIDIGTVKKTSILNNGDIEVVLSVTEKSKSYLKKNAVAYIGSDGLMGNKVVNIEPGLGEAAAIEENDVLNIASTADTDAMLNTLAKTNNDIAAVAAGLKQVVERINKSTGFWKLLNDETVSSNIAISAADIRATAANFKSTAESVKATANVLNSILTDVKNGKGPAGVLLADTITANNIKIAAAQLNKMTKETNDVILQADKIVKGLDAQINDKNGNVQRLLTDTTAVSNIAKSLDNIQKGTQSFNQNMEALKHNFLFRGYFKKLEKEKAKE